MMSQVGRRAFLAGAAAPLLAPPAAPSPSSPSEDLTRYLAARVDEMARQWDARRARITTPDQLEARNREVRRQVRAMLGPLPPPAPVQAELTGSVQRHGYRIEKLLFESRPGLWVSANVYVPAGAGPFPAVLSPCGHYELARMVSDYQFAYLDLVEHGFLVLAYDPPGQGERRHYWNRAVNANDESLRSVDEHSMAGHLLLLLGDSLTGYLVQDGIRAIDYLLTRPDVDKNRIACAGHSGGGTLTMFLACVDERIRCAVVNEGGTAHRWPVTLRGDGSPPVSDAEQNLFPAAIHGIDACDMHAAIAPRPLLALIEEYAGPFNRSAAHIRARYELLSAGDRFATDEARARHAWTAKLRLATVDWCSRWFRGRPGPAAEPERKAEDPEILYATPQGSLRDAAQGATLFAHIAVRAAAIDDSRPAPRSRTEFLAFQKGLRERLPQLLRIPPAARAASFRNLESTHRAGVLIDQLEIAPEPGITLAATSYRADPPAPSARPLLLVSAHGRAAHDSLALSLAGQGWSVLALDPRGVEPSPPPTRPPSNRYGHLFNTETGQAYLAWSLDQDLFGLRVFDILRAAALAPELLRTKGASLAVCGFSDAALWALCAAAVEPNLTIVVCHAGLVSWRALLASDRYLHGAGALVRGIFPHCDLPQIAASLAPRRLVISSPAGALRQPVSTPESLAWTRTAYTAAGAPDQFLTPPPGSEPPAPAGLLRWLT